MNKLPQSVINFVIDGLRDPNRDVKREDVLPRDLANYDAVVKYRKASKPVVKDFIANGYDIIDLQEIKFNSKFSNDERILNLAISWLKKVEDRLLIGALLGIIFQNKHTSKNLSLILPLAIDQWKNAGNDAKNVRAIAGNILMRYPQEELMLTYAKLAVRAEEGRYSESDTSNERWYLVEALGKIKNPRVCDLLTNLLDDERILNFVIKAFGNQKNSKYIPLIEKYVSDSRKYVRDEAIKALSKIQKSTK
jgi:hypothetical protein